MVPPRCAQPSLPAPLFPLLQDVAEVPWFLGSRSGLPLFLPGGLFRAPKKFLHLVDQFPGFERLEENPPCAALFVPPLVEGREHPAKDEDGARPGFFGSP